MADLSTPREHEQYREAIAKPEGDRTDADRLIIDWIEGRPVAGGLRRFYTGTALGDR